MSDQISQTISSLRTSDLKSDSRSIKLFENVLQIKQPQVIEEEIKNDEFLDVSMISNNHIYDLSSYIKRYGKQDIQTLDHMLILQDIGPKITKNVDKILQQILKLENRSGCMLQEINELKPSERTLCWCIIQNIPKLYISLFDELNQTRFQPAKRAETFEYFFQKFKNRICQITSDFNRIKIYVNQIRSLNEVKREINQLNKDANSEFKWVFYGNQQNLTIFQEQLKEDANLRLRTIFPIILTDRSYNRINKYLPNDLFYINMSAFNLDNAVMNLYEVLDKINIFISPNGEHLIIKVVKPFSSEQVKAYVKQGTPAHVTSRKEEFQNLSNGFKRLLPWRKNDNPQKYKKIEENYVPKTDNAQLKAHFLIPDMMKHFLPDKIRLDGSSMWNYIRRSWKENVAQIIQLSNDKLIMDDEIPLCLPSLDIVQLENNMVCFNIEIGQQEFQMDTSLRYPLDLNNKINFMIDKLVKDLHPQNLMENLKQQMFRALLPNLNTCSELDVIQQISIESIRKEELYQNLLMKNEEILQQMREVSEMNSSILESAKAMNFDAQNRLRIIQMASTFKIESLMMINVVQQLQYSQWISQQKIKQDVPKVNQERINKFTLQASNQNEIVKIITIQEEKFLSSAKMPPKRKFRDLSLVQNNESNENLPDMSVRKKVIKKAPKI